MAIITHVYNKTYWDIWFRGTPYNNPEKEVKRVKDWCDGNVCYNLAYFEMKSGRTVNYVRAQGYDVGYGGVPERLTVSQGNICGGYQVGIRENEVVTRGDGRVRTRNAIGLLKSGRIVIAQSTTKMTERSFCLQVALQVSQYWHDTVTLLLMEDGGGSTSMYSDISKSGIAPEGGRKVATVTCLKRRLPIAFSRTLKIGDKGEDVREYQMLIGGVVTDGEYGNLTKKRTRLVQQNLKAAGLYTGKVDGVCGPLMQKALRGQK